MKLSLFNKFCVLMSWVVLAVFIILIVHQGSPKVFSLLNANDTYTKVASHWERSDLGVKCRLCPHNCFLTEGAKGKCKVRMNKNNTLYTQVYNQPVSINIDPIEKKPIFHMMPGTAILSLSTVGCPLTCTFCQNWSLSQTYPETVKKTTLLSPQDIVDIALKNNVPSIAYTYGEPVVFFEYMKDIAVLAKKNNIRNVMVTSGFFNPEPLIELAPYFDIIKVDLKGIDETFYENEVGGYLSSVLEALKTLKEKNVLTEIVNLVVTNRNDKNTDFKLLSEWVFNNLGADTPLFFSRFHPNYKLTNLPPTPISTLEMARDIAMDSGLNFVYIGNVPGHTAENTYCPNDNTLLIERSGYFIRNNNLKNGKCPICGRKIPGVWE